MSKIKNAIRLHKRRLIVHTIKQLIKIHFQKIKLLNANCRWTLYGVHIIKVLNPRRYTVF